MTYKIQPGIVLVTICDVDMLVATREKWESCPVIRPIPHLWAIYWKLMEKGKTSEDVMGLFSRLFKSPKINSGIEKAMTTLYEEGLLLIEEDNA